MKTVGVKLAYIFVLLDVIAIAILNIADKILSR